VILICYDGSDDAKAAIAHLGERAPGTEATLLTVWESAVTFGSGSSNPAHRLSPLATIANPEDANAKMLAAATEVAEEGAKLANEAGLKAGAVTSEQLGSVAETILVSAEKLDADVIAIGSRGFGGLGSFVLGSISQRILQHADRPVLVIPSAAVAARRHKLLEAEKVPAA
jgi:nucleotide-binding universal stress UspA family protein